MSVKSYLLSLPERLVRSTLGLGAGVVREAGELALPVAVRRSQLYQNLVETTLRYVIRQEALAVCVGARRRGAHGAAGPYVRAAIEQFSPQRRTLTDRLVEKFQSFEDKAMSIALPRPGTDEYDPASAAYVARTPALDDAARQLEVQRDEVVELFSIVADANADFRYAPGKWSIREVLGHLADTERILAYRLLRIGRGDATPLPGFDENTYVPAADFERRPITDVLDEWVAVRNATLALVRGMPSDAWTRRGVANNTPVTARALVYVIVGHVEHHREGLAHNYGVVI